MENMAEKNMKWSLKKTAIHEIDWEFHGEILSFLKDYKLGGKVKILTRGLIIS